MMTTEQHPMMAQARECLATAWTDFLDANPDDLTSPEDLSDHALMTGAQFEDWALEALLAALTTTQAAEDAALPVVQAHEDMVQAIWQVMHDFKLETGETLGYLISSGNDKVNLCNRILKVRLAHTEPATPPDGWKLIASAPKDGTRLLMVHHGYRTIGSWREYHSGTPDWRGGAGQALHPTHWMPLPAAPNLPAKEEG